MKLSVYVDGAGKDFKIRSLDEVKPILKKYMEKQNKERCSFEIRGDADLKSKEELYCLFG